MIENLPLLFDVSEVPRFYSALIAPAEEQIGGQLVPADDIDIGIVCLVNASRAFSAFYPNIPDLDGLIG